MRVRLIAFLVVLVAGAIAIPSAALSVASGSRIASLKIALPAPGQVKVSQVTVKLTAPKGKRVGRLKVLARNGSQLATAQTNTQVVVAVSPTSSRQRVATFKVWVFIHHWPPAPAGDHRAGAAAESLVDLAFEDGSSLARINAFTDSQSCDELRHDLGYVMPRTGKLEPKLVDFLGDGDIGPGKSVSVENLIQGFDTPAEEQLDNAVWSHQPTCAGAEDPNNDAAPF